MLPSIEPCAGSGTRRNMTSVSAACLACRRRHLKCDGQCPCSRCITANLDCAYVASRRGYNGRKRMSYAVTEKPVLIAASTAITIDPAPPVTGLEIPSHFDPFLFPDMFSSLSGVNTTLPVSTSSQTTASTTLPVLSLPNPLDSIDDPNPCFGFEVPRGLLPREHYIDSFYQNFFAAHPFILPKEPFLVLAQGTSVEPLIAAIRWIGSLYIDVHASQSLLKEAFRLVDGNPLRDGFLVQARLLLIIGLDGIRQRKKANKLMSEARGISTQIGMNTSSFATTHGQGIPILEESWRRTWWELYVVDALMSGVHLTNTFALYDVPTDVGLPCEEDQYLLGQIPPRMHLNDTENIGLFDSKPFSSYTYRIQCACILGRLQRMPTDVEYIDKLLANWMLRLPASKYAAFCDGTLDEMMFQAIMMWHAISILLHQPHSQLDPSPTYHIKACAPNTPAPSSDAFNTHTKRTIRAAEELSKLITHRAALLSHTHFFAYMVTLSSTIHLSKWSLAFVTPDDEGIRQHMRRNIGALIKYAEKWPMAQRLGCQVKDIAKEVYMMKKRQRQQSQE